MFLSVYRPPAVVIMLAGPLGQGAHVHCCSPQRQEKHQDEHPGCLIRSQSNPLEKIPGRGLQLIWYERLYLRRKRVQRSDVVCCGMFVFFTENHAYK